MQTAADVGTGPIREAPELAWRVLGLLNLFRLFVPVVLLAVFALDDQPRLVGAANEAAFRTTCLVYFAVSLALFLVRRQRWAGLAVQAYAPVVVDVFAIGALLYCSGGAESGLGLLLIVPVGGIGMLGTARMALFVAASASLVLLAQQFAAWTAGFAYSFGFAQAGYYGVAIFILGGASAFITQRLRATEAEVRRRDVDLANLAELSEYIVQHLRESIVVVDAQDRIRLINESARQILGPDARPAALLGEISPRLLYHVERWRRQPDGTTGETAAFVAADGSREIEAYFAPLGRSRPAPLIVFLEDTTRLQERVQQTKLAALGRLSASIAHEIRNPVGAMSHAAQLLAEAPSLGEQEKRLTQIITSHADRVSTIIANVLQLSRRESTKPERIYVGEWLKEFLEEFRATLQLPPERVTVGTPDGDLEVRVDPTHLHQIVWNLCENALRYSNELETKPAIELHLGRLRSSGRPYLEVIDRGRGIPDEKADRIFEPFFTDSHGGTGLGLFIARELAQCNGALLLYEPRAGGGSIFRVIFADPQRWEA